MRRSATIILIHLALVVGMTGCGEDSKPKNCGGAGQLCCGSTSCNLGFSCQGGTCQAGEVACGTSGQVCCATGTACRNDLVCSAGNCVTPDPTTASQTVCSDGAVLQVAGATLTIPSGALATCSTVTFSRTTDTASGYSLYSPIFKLEPDTLDLAQPATIAIQFTGDATLATMFWSRTGTTGFQAVEGGSAAGVIYTAQVSRPGKGFVANGINFDDPADPSCVVSRMVDGRLINTSATVALFFTVDDCWGRPVTGLQASDFAVSENGAPPSVESTRAILQQKGVEIFISLVIDMSASTAANLDSVIASAKAFVDDLQANNNVSVQIAVQPFAGDQDLDVLYQPPTLDMDLVKTRLDDLTTYTPNDRNSTNLNGAVTVGLTFLADAEQQFRQRNDGGAFTIGYLVLFTDGKDTAGWVTHGEAKSAVDDSTDQIVAVGLESADYDADALAELAPNGVVTATNADKLSAAFTALASRMERQINRFYLLGYCSPTRNGSSTVAVSVAHASNQGTASYTFTESGFDPLQGCTASTLATICEDKQCGGLGCGYCDDRVAGCSATTSHCVNYCLAQAMCTAGGSLNPNSRGYAQACDPTPDNFQCGAQCVDTTTDPTNCGGCGNTCGGQTPYCVASACSP